MERLTVHEKVDIEGGLYVSSEDYICVAYKVPRYSEVGAKISDYTFVGFYYSNDQ